MPLNPLVFAGTLLALAPMPAPAQGKASGLPEGAGKDRVEALCLSCRQAREILNSSGIHAGIVRHMRATREGNLVIHQSSTNRILLVTPIR